MIDPVVKKEYVDLSQDAKASNRAAARRLLDHLALIGYVVELQADDGDGSLRGLQGEVAADPTPGLRSRVSGIDRCVMIPASKEDDMPGKIFYRERRKVDEGEKKPRFNIVAVADVNLKIHAKHLRKSELEEIAQAIGAELVQLTVEESGHKFQVGDQD